MLYTLHTLELYPRYIAARSHRCIKCYVPSFLPFFPFLSYFRIISTKILASLRDSIAFESGSSREDDRVQIHTYGRVIDAPIENTVSLHTGTFNFSTRNDKRKGKKKKEKKKNEIQGNVRVTNTSKLIFLRDRSSKKIDSKDRRDQDPTIARPKFRVNILGDYLLPSNTIEGIIN